MIRNIRLELAFWVYLPGNLRRGYSWRELRTLQSLTRNWR